jgi:LPS sulfotransferase NodH
MSQSSPIASWLGVCSPGSYTPSTHLGFVIVFVPRTGSNLLAGMLDSHPEILCHHEVFNARGIHRSLSYKNTDLDFGTVEARDQDPCAFLRRVFGFTGGKRIIGFKIGPGENNRALLSLLLNRGIRKIVLTRRRQLHAYTSGLIAQRTKVWSIPANSANSIPGAAKVPVDVAEFRRFVRKRRAFHALVRLTATITMQRILVLDYEDLGTPRTNRRALEFLGADPTVTLRPRTGRQNPPRLADRIENFERVKQSLVASGLGRYVEDDD